MMGLAAAHMLYAEHIRSAFAEAFPKEIDKFAFGLVGSGSECYGFDDEISRDHDWGARLYVWMTDPVYERIGGEAFSVYKICIDRLRSGERSPIVDTTTVREGPISVSTFYRANLGRGNAPKTLADWLYLKEEGLSLCTNGEVFEDGGGEFSSIRTALNGYYPRDLYLKKVATWCRLFTQLGQYNLDRAIRRGETVSAHHIRSLWVASVASLAHLVERRYRPFYKWLFRSLRSLGRFGQELYGALEKTMDQELEVAISENVDSIGEMIGRRLEENAIVRYRGEVLKAYADEIEAAIHDATLRDELAIVDW